MVDRLLGIQRNTHYTCNSEKCGIYVGSQTALQNLMLVQGHIQKFKTSTPPGYYLIGLWGHGVSSYAFYYQVVDTWQRVFFRLPYDGVYANEEKDAVCIRKFLTQYLALLPDLKSAVTSWVAIESMWQGSYKAILTSGKVIELNESLFQCDNIRERFRFLLASEAEK
jgi:hypothetical protein